MFRKRFNFALLLFVCVATFLPVAQLSVRASGLDGIGSTQQTTANATNAPSVQSSGISEEGADALIGGIGVNDDDMQRASAFARPLVTVVNYLVAVAMVVLMVVVFGWSMLIDLPVIAIPPLRTILMNAADLQPSPQGAPGMGGSGGMGMPGGMYPGGGAGYGGSYGHGRGYGATGGAYGAMGGAMGGMDAQQQAGGFGQKLVQWVSDELLASMKEARQGLPDQTGVPKMKMVLPLYARKRAVFLVLFGITAIVFSTMIFTDLGIMMGLKILTALTGIRG